MVNESSFGYSYNIRVTSAGGDQNQKSRDDNPIQYDSKGMIMIGKGA